VQQQVKFIITRFSSIGDIVLTAPVVNSIRTHYGDAARIDYVTLNRFKSAVELIDGIDKIHGIEKSTAEVSKELQEIWFDYLLDLHGNIRSRSLARSLHALVFTVKKKPAARLSLVLGMRRQPIEHFTDRSLSLLDTFYLSNELPNPWGKLNTEKPYFALPSKFIALTPGAAHAGKQLPISMLKEICGSLSEYQFLVLGGDDMKSTGESLEAEFANVVSFCGKGSLKNTAYILQKASLAIGGDTGAMHIAAAVGVKLISVWGCTRPSLGLSPWKAHPDSIMLEPLGRGDRPCSRHGAKCRFKKLGKDLCINHVGSERIVAEVRRLV
jgi:ADP-heptose:LPS heptosyltransferase